MALKWINDQYLLLLGIAIFWLVSGLYVVVKPRGFLERTQAPWTKLPVWAARLLGIGFLIGGVLMLRAYILRPSN